MRRQPPYQSSRAIPEASPVRVVRGGHAEADDRAVLLDRTADGAELEIGPISTSRGARWTRAETLLGLGLVGILFGGALINTLANPSPKPTPSAPAAVACDPVPDDSKPTRARLRVAGDGGTGLAGRTGRTSEGTAPSPDDWLLPRPSEGLDIAPGTPLEAVAGKACVTGWSMWVVPTVDVGVTAEATMRLLGSGTFAGTAAPVQLPSHDVGGDWTLRLATAYATESGKTLWSVKFYRLVVGGAPYQTPPPPTPRPTPVATLAIAPSAPCKAISDASGPPLASLVVAGVDDPIIGTLGAFTWFGAVTPPANLALGAGPSVPFEGDVTLRLASDICATRWTVAAMQVPLTQENFSEGGFGAQTEWASFTNNRGDNPVISQQNRIPVVPTGLGRMLVRAVLNFEGGHNEQVYWLLRVAAFDPPLIKVVAPDGSSITPVVGCGAGIGTNENYFSEECGPGVWPALENGPTLTVHVDDIVRIVSPDWPLSYWNLNWGRQADVRPGESDPESVGYLGGQDTLEPGIVRWIVPPEGDWIVALNLGHEEPNRQYNLPMYVRVRVLP